MATPEELEKLSLEFSIRDVEGVFAKLCLSEDGEEAESIRWDVVSKAWSRDKVPGLGTILMAPLASEEDLKSAGVSEPPMRVSDIP